jgi:uncharacterized pyridoxal phosphate-containing UPF0001 family protein
MSIETTAEVLARYRQFMTQGSVKSFLDSGGKVFVSSEGRPFAQVEPLIAEGHRHFAEKFVQDSERKWAPVARHAVELHCYGNVQRNKLARVCDLYSMIESVNRESLVKALSHRLSRGLEVPPLLVQVNCGREPQKTGFLPEEADAAIEKAMGSGLRVLGVMAIPPRGENPVKYFRFLRLLADRHHLRECSMGLTADFEQAIEEGATLIRVGRAIFGPH